MSLGILEFWNFKDDVFSDIVKNEVKDAINMIANVSKCDKLEEQ